MLIAMEALGTSLRRWDRTGCGCSAGRAVAESRSRLARQRRPGGECPPVMQGSPE